MTPPCLRTTRKNLASLLMAALVAASAPVASGEIKFNQDVRPILSDRCFFCHGPDPDDRKAGLRLDVRDDALKATSSGRPAIAPGKPEDSEIMVRILSHDPDEQMPPAKSNLRLSPEERKTLEQWIQEGAPYEGHWAFESLSDSPEIPKPQATDRVRNEIDAFVQARLDDENWQLRDEASRERLIRRVTFDLTGLPPTLKEIDRFVIDDSPTAYEDLVDRLLRSERYGEHLAAEWLDVARYSDSYGYQVDRDRFVWPWRDWVIRAFNENLPYDDFITWQLAGDLLPNASRDQVLATTFNRLHSQKVEGGSVPEEFRIEYVADRTHTFGTAFLGLTLECSRCHTHKYDPITHEEYYQLSSFFANIDEAGLYSYFTNSIPTPTLGLTKPEEAVQLDQLSAKISQLERSVTATQSEVPALSGQLAHYPFDERVEGKFPNLENAEQAADSSSANTIVPGRSGSALQLTGDDAVRLKLGNFTRNQPFSISCWLSTPDEKERAVVFHRSRAWTDAASRGYELLLEEGRLKWSLIHYWPGNAISIQALETMPTETWTHVTVTYDGSSRADGLRLFVNGREAAVEIARDHLTKNITGGGGDQIAIGERFRDRGFAGGLIDEFRVFDRALTEEEATRLAGSEFGTPNENVVVQGTAEQRAELRSLREQRSKIADGVQEIMVMRETMPPRQSYLLARGAYDARTDPVHADTPDFLPPFPDEMPRNRLGLAQWLTSPNQPLTARVTVNRYWQRFFGKGLVGTPEDFGSQGSLPTHPELLDWLAYDFMHNGWNLKAFIKRLVMSQTYRQSSRPTPDQKKRDPENELLARAPRYRLSAEMIRDNLLYSSGLLVEQLGGAPVKPYEVAASFKPVAHEKGSGLYRRSLYTYWKRTSPAPVMIALDAPKRDVCMVKRDVTATPLQAFVYMNDPLAVEASRTLAATLLREQGDESSADLLAKLFRKLTSRQPQEKELAVLERMLGEQQAHFKAHPNQAKAFLETGESPTPEDVDTSSLAALTAVTTGLLAHDDCVMKR